MLNNGLKQLVEETNKKLMENGAWGNLNDPEHFADMNAERQDTYRSTPIASREREDDRESRRQQERQRDIEDIMKTYGISKEEASGLLMNASYYDIMNYGYEFDLKKKSNIYKSDDEY